MIAAEVMYASVPLGSMLSVKLNRVMKGTPFISMNAVPCTGRVPLVACQYGCLARQYTVDTLKRKAHWLMGVSMLGSSASAAARFVLQAMLSADDTLVMSTRYS